MSIFSCSAHHIIDLSVSQVGEQRAVPVYEQVPDCFSRIADKLRHALNLEDCSKACCQQLWCLQEHHMEGMLASGMLASYNATGKGRT